MLGLKIGVSLVKEQGNGTTGTAIVTIGDSSVELPYTNGAFDTENPEVVINLLKGNTTRVLNCSVTGIDIGYDVYGGGASNIADGTNVNGYAGGFVGYNNEGSYRVQYAPYLETLWDSMWLWDKRPTRYWNVDYTSDTVALVSLGREHDMCVLWYKYRNLPWIRNDFTGGNTILAPVILPIIDPDFDTVLCDMVRDVRVADSTDTTLTLMWNGGNAVQWEVVYRGMCEWDTEYGPWSDILDVWTGVHHDTPVSISNLDRFTQMMPNPARGQVTVLSSYRLSRVVVYDLTGHAVLEHEDEGLATTFDVSGLAKGVYVVAIHTPAGIATKRLVVE